MPYNYATFGDFKIALGQLLSDENSVFWTDTEKGILINSALREWNSISRMFRDRGSFTATAGTVFYDLMDVLENGSAERFLAPTILDSQLLQQCKYMLMEPFPDDATTFTDSLTAADFLDGFERRRNRFLMETGLVLTASADQVVNAGDGRIVLADDSIIDVRRAAWQIIGQVTLALFREDEFASGTFSPLWTQTAGKPRRYAIYPDPLLTLQLIPPPNDTGTLVLQTISSGVLLDDFTPYILWGVLADICSTSGPTSDDLRSQYAEHRYQEGVQVGKQVAIALQAYISGNPVSINSVFDLDSFQPLWTTAGIPKKIGVLGSNLVTVVPTAASDYVVIIDAVRNAPKLVNDADLVPIGREYVDLLLNYCTHLATFKQGGSEFQATFADYDAFVKAAMGYNNRMYAQNLFFETLVDRTAREEKQLPLRTEEAAVA